MGVPSGSDILLEHMRIADSDAVGISMNATARIFRSEFVNNSKNEDFHGFSAAAVKSTTEYEAGSNYVHDNLANGLWCDHGCTHNASRNDGAGAHKGAWFHDNLAVGNGRFGMRYEYSPRLVGNQLSDDAHFTAERNEIHGNGEAGISMHDAQNGTISDNVFGAGFGYGLNDRPPPGSPGTAVLFADGNQHLYGTNPSSDLGRTDLYNARATGNDLNGERITNCDKPDEIAYCANDTPQGRNTGTIVRPLRHAAGGGGNTQAGQEATRKSDSLLRGRGSFPALGHRHQSRPRLPPRVPALALAGECMRSRLLLRQPIRQPPARRVRGPAPIPAFPRAGRRPPRRRGA